MTDLNILFATRNGEGVIAQTLQGYQAQQAEGIDWRLIIVDNGSTDETPAIIRHYQQTLPITLLEQPAPGKNRALNLGLNHLDSDFIIVSDDDAPPEPDFLRHWLEAARTRTGYGIFGASIEPSFQAEPPKWMRESRFHYEEIYAVRDLPEGPLAPTDIFGPNMAVRREVFDAGLTFNEAIGPNGANQDYPMGSETEFCRRVGKEGHKAWFAAKPRVHHLIRPHQTSTEFWTGRAYRHGLGFARQQLASGSLQSLSENALHLAKRWAKECVRFKLGHLHPDMLKRQQHLWQYHWNRGFRDGLQPASAD